MGIGTLQTSWNKCPSAKFGVKFWQPFKVISWTIFNSLADMGNKTCDCSHSAPQLRKRLIVGGLGSI